MAATRVNATKDMLPMNRDPASVCNSDSILQRLSVSLCIAVLQTSMSVWSAMVGAVTTVPTTRATMSVHAERVMSWRQTTGPVEVSWCIGV